MNLVFDLHIHTCFSDGSFSFEELLLRLKALGVSVCGITDHFETGHPHSVKVSKKEYNKCFEAFRKQAALAGIRVLLGAETGIGENGLLLPTAIPKVDYIIASVHRVPFSKGMKEAEYWHKYMELIEGALNSGGFNIIGHIEGYMPLSPLLSLTDFGEKRKAEKYFAKKYLTLDWYRKIGKIMRDNRIAVEIHEMSHSPRIEVLRILNEMGVKFSYGTDSHSLEQLSKREFLRSVINELNLSEEDFIPLIRPDFDKLGWFSG